jgi:hypothetical protein
MLHTRTTVGVYRLTYNDALCTTNSVYAQLMLLSDRLCRGLFYYRTPRNTSYVTTVQPMWYCDTTYAVRS